MDFNEYLNVNEYPSSALAAFTDGRLRPEELNPRKRQELREAVLWEMDKERMRREIIMAKIAELRMSLSVQMATDTAVRYVADGETGGMSLEERIGKRVALKHAIRKHGMDPFSSY